MELIAEQVVKSFGRKRVIDRVSLTLRPGLYGLLGANGAGKTTLLKMLAGSSSPTSGKIIWNGRPLSEWGGAYAARLGYLPQQLAFYPDFTAENSTKIINSHILALFFCKFNKFYLNLSDFFKLYKKF